MPIYVLSGEEEFEIARKVAQLKEELLDPAWASVNFLRQESSDLRTVIEAAASVPFGPGNKVVLFDRCEMFTKKRSKSDDDADGKSASKSAKLIEDLDEALAAVAPGTHLIFAAPHNFDASLKVSKVFLKHVKPETFEKKKYWAGSENRELLSWANKEAHRYGAVIDDQAVFYLAESTEVNLRQMSSEMGKAAVFILPEKKITLSVVSTLSPHFSHVFALLDHWAYGRQAQVLESIQELQSRQVSAHIVIATLQTTLSKWIFYRSEMDKASQALPGGRDVRRREVSLQDLARDLAFDQRGAFMVQQDLKRIKSLSLDFLVEKKRQLTELEDLIKSGQMPEAHALPLFFTR